MKTLIFLFFASLFFSQTPQEPPELAEATEMIKSVGQLFKEGKFDEAKAAKATADSLYGNSHWTPQLLYIESI